MLVIIDDHRPDSESFPLELADAGVMASRFLPSQFSHWVNAAEPSDLDSIQAFIIGACDARGRYPALIRQRSSAPVIALNERQSVDQTLELFAAGMDDVVRRPVHVREIMARVSAIRRRRTFDCLNVARSDIHVAADGRDPDVGGAPLALPRRERRILECLAANKGRWISKTQIYNAVYGMLDEHVDEAVVESHVSKLRKKLRHRLGYDPIEARRFAGYRLARPD